MRRFLLNISVFAAVTSAFVFDEVRPARADSTGAAIAGGVVGLAVGAALSKKHKHSKVIIVPDYQPPYPPGAYPNAFAQSYSPIPGIICYPVQRACYDGGGAFNPKWTNLTYVMQ
jgi:hypothetical protein